MEISYLKAAIIDEPWPAVSVRPWEADSVREPSWLSIQEEHRSRRFTQADRPMIPITGDTDFIQPTAFLPGDNFAPPFAQVVGGRQQCRLHPHLDCLEQRHIRKGLLPFRTCFCFVRTANLFSPSIDTRRRRSNQLSLLPAKRSPPSVTFGGTSAEEDASESNLDSAPSGEG